MAKPQSYSASEIANIFKITTKTFRKRLPDLQREENFPTPLPMPGHPRWSKLLVDRWLDTNGSMQVDHDTALEDEVIDRQLDQALEGIA